MSGDSRLLDVHRLDICKYNLVEQEKVLIYHDLISKYFLFIFLQLLANKYILKKQKEVLC